LNEPEGIVKGDGGWGKMCSWNEMRSFLKACASTIHRSDRSRLVSVGGGEYALQKGYYLGLGLDFFDYHIYTDNVNLTPVQDIRRKWFKRRLANRKELNAPILIGEFGQNNGPNARSDDELQRRVTVDVFRNVKNKGYAGALIWSYEWPGAPTKEWDRLLRGNGDSSWRPAAFELQKFKF
ncbi:MAG: cellulase family glycosylhydrolase, partial [Desulfobulbia bacterium]